MENLNYLLAAFIIIWAVLFGYIGSLSWRQRHVRREIDRLKEELRPPPTGERGSGTENEK
jgi:CcmD family protein